jgi:rhodanese-related sulfurtransferase
MRQQTPCIRVLMLAVWIFVMSMGRLAAEEDFPYREKYPDVPTISTQDLFDKYKQGGTIIVDVRSDIEFAAIHPVGSQHIPIGRSDFIDRVGALIEMNPGAEIAFYCNGITCLKSYEAVEKAQEAGYKNCFAYDAGIPDWEDVYPEHTLLLGEKVTDPAKQIIPESEFKKHLSSFEEFKAKASDPKAIVIDVRDHIQKSGDLPGIETALSIPLDKFIPNFVEREINQDKTLLIFDQVGKQVFWLMYYLVKHGYQDYFFLNKGATGVLEKQEYK